MSISRVAAIDIGTNSIKLLVAANERGQITPLHEDSKTTRLGEGVAETGKLSADAIERTVAVVKTYADTARQLGATRIVAVATSAARDAANGQEFLAKLHTTAGIKPEIISGEREAELIFVGVSTDAKFRDQPLLVMDVGGGSAELIAGEAGRIASRVCVPGGAVRLTERFIHGDRVSQAEFEALIHHARELLAPVIAKMSLSGRRMVGTGGAITTAAAIELHLKEFSLEKINHYELTLERMESILDMLRHLPLEARRKVPGLPKKRADIIVAGMAVFVVAMQLARMPAITVSTRGLRFGLLASTPGLIK